MGDAALHTMAPPPEKRPWIVEFGKAAREPLNRFLSRQSLVSCDPVPDKGAFPWLRFLEDAAPAIQEEAAQILANIDGVPPMNVLSPDHRIIAKDGGWRSFFLVGYRFRLEENCARCPRTMEALSHVPGLVTALFSILEPGMHVGRHTGVSRGILIAHLGLKVPRAAERCWMEVETTPVHWSERETFIFDDTCEHEVWNNTDEHRVILLVQFQRPMAWLGRVLTNILIWAVRWSPYIQDARKNVDYWEDRFNTAEARANASAGAVTASTQ